MTITDTTKEACGACGREFDTLNEVFTHPCDAIDTSHHLPHLTLPGDSIDPPERGSGAGKGGGQPDRSNRYPGNCIKCGGRVEAEMGLLVKDNSKQRGGTAWGVEHKRGECVEVTEPTRTSGISSRQEKYVRDLLAERNPDADADAVIDIINELPNPINGASSMIDALKQLPKQAPKVCNEEVGDGFWYIHGDPGTIVKVQRAVHGSGNLYAKRLVPEGDRGSFEYWQGGYNQLVKAVADGTAERLTLKKASELGHLYGMCCVCGATLTDENSIAAGIGPVCARKF